MRSSTILATLFASLAIAAPAHQNLHKRAYEYKVVTEVVTVTVTAGKEPETVRVQKTVIVKPEAAKVETTSSKSSSTTTTIKTTTTTPPPPPTTTTTTTTPPPPPPTTTSPPPPPPTTTTPPPAPTTTQAAVVVQDTQPVQQSNSNSGNAVRDAALNSHNAYRSKHHAGPVSWDDSLASSAAALAGGCTNKHGIIVGGQNIAAKGFSGQSGPGDAALMSEAVDSWYNEVSGFGPYYGQSDVSDGSVLHFTQVVWKDTTRIGCAVNFCGTEGNIFPGFSAYTIVCNYQSAGNFAGQYAANVAAP